MNASDQARWPSRVLLLLPTARDGALTADILEKNGLSALICEHPSILAAQLAAGAGALLVAEEWLAQGAQGALMRALEEQPRWSDLPILVLTRSGADSQQAADALRNSATSLLERPLRLTALVSTVRSALRARSASTDPHAPRQLNAPAMLAETARRGTNSSRCGRDCGIRHRSVSTALLGRDTPGMATASGR
jgi:DNA-binding NtrC family response regulator